MDRHKLFNDAMNAAREIEKTEQHLITKIYIVGDQYYFNAWEVTGKDIDYTLVRGSQDPKLESTLETKKKYKRSGF